MDKISVVMSVYNEDKTILEESIKSILNQTYSLFEFIIIVDNPLNVKAKNLISDLAKTDSRIKYQLNDKNIGLAKSLNIAINLSNYKYIVRFDADDICMPDRLEKQLSFIIKSKVDVACSDYYYINNKGEYININNPLFTEKQIIKTLPLRNVIHHPTVIMKKEAFLNSGGYEDIPIAQDYYLWLKLLKNKAKFAMMKEKLIKYRINLKGVSYSKRYQQYLTLKYIRKLYKKNKQYKKTNYENYLKMHHFNNENRINNFIKFYNINSNLKNLLKNKKIFKFILCNLRILIFSRYYKRNFIQIFKFWYIIKFYKEN
jgi:glycosyltransferase involved in cell wall biosynthesis